MRVEICPANGVICKTTYADLHIPPTTYMTTKEILMTKAIETPSNSNFISLEKYLDLVRGEAKVLQGLSTHPTDAVAIGLLVDPAHPVVLAAARTERKQRDLTDNDLVAEAEAETAATRAALARLRPLVEKARTGKISAEEVVAALQAEPDPKVARDRFLAMKAGSTTVRDEKEILISPDVRPLPRKFAAAKAYALNVKVTGLEENPSSAKLALIDEALPSSLFWKNDVGVRTISTRVTDSGDFRLLNLCMAYKVFPLVELAIEFDMGGSGRSYTASLIRIVDPAATLNSVRKASKMQNDDLFNFPVAQS